MTDERADLMVEKFINAPPALVWRAWSEPEHLARWWIPAPMECQVVKLDLRPGGGFETRMREGAGPFQPHVAACFLEIVPNARLVFTTMLTEGWRPAEPWLSMTAIMTLAAEGRGTRYTASALHRSPADARKHEEMGFHEGWGITLDQLAALTEGLAEPAGR